MALLLSMSCNIFLIIDEIRFKKKKDFFSTINKAITGELNTTTWKKGFNILTQKLKGIDANLLRRKYYYINIWTNWCIPCIKEMPWLDSLAGTLHKDVGYIFISDISEELAKSALKRKNFNLKNFLFLNDMNDFVSGICNERGIKNKVYPMVLIVDVEGKIFHYSTGAYENPKEAKEFADIINKLP